ncbi:hypothetical protein AB0J80_20380 [Actinoplanes sp. NPDC049548]|uniref:hypothetical protein n=1 Tax=Actinoplanes sp. NPDC049548 TaxID=3155152 RepID=UPI00342D6569
MRVSVSGGVAVRPDQRISSAGPEPETASPAPGTPVVVGPADAPESDRVRAVALLAALVEAGGAVAADAGADLGGGFCSARVDGGTGDRRDAVLAALAVPRFADRLGPPAAVLTALFGPTATKPLGAATLDAIRAGRTPVLRYAVAASDLLGPEQLVRLLALRAPDGVDPFPEGLPSVVGRHLDRVLRPLPGPRRLALLTDLWEQACAAAAKRQRTERIVRSQRGPELVDALRERLEHYEEQQVVGALGRRPTLARAALWYPPRTFWTARFRGVLHDALAATVLARVAAAAFEDGTEEALRGHRSAIEAAAAMLTKREAASAAQRVKGLTGHPARPGSYLRELARLAPGVELTAKQVAGARERLATARAYGELALERATEFVQDAPYLEAPSAQEALADWRCAGLADWRSKAGYFSPGRLADWEQPRPDALAPLAQRLRAETDREPAEVETVGDLLWIAELADAVARLYGHPAAEIMHETVGVEAVTRPVSDDTFLPLAGSVALTAARTAQLAELGGSVPAKPRSWADLVAGLAAGAEAAEALVGRFPVPAAVEVFDGGLLPGTETRIEVARTGSTLTAWAAYMGNCIAGPYYSDEAAKGRSVLIALRDPDGRILANAELRPPGKGWRVAEVKARFNEEPEPALLEAVREWVRSLPVPRESPAEPDPAPPPAPRRGRRPSPADRLTAEIGEQLGALAAVAVRPDSTLTGLIGAPASAEGLVALRRLAPATLERAVRSALAAPAAAGRLWEATATRPLAAAVSAMPPEVHHRLEPLLRDEPLPGALRKLARLEGIADARAADLIALRVRAAVGGLLRADAAELAAAVRMRPHAGLLRAATLAVTSWGGLPAAPVTAVAARRRVRLPGFPESSLRDERWQGSWPDAVELGGVPGAFWNAIAAHGLLVPSSWLPPGGWPVLWARAWPPPARNPIQIR